MNFSESSKLEKEIGFVSSSTKKGRCSSKEIKEKFGLGEAGETIKKRSKFSNINGIPHKWKNGKLVPLTKLKK